MRKKIKINLLTLSFRNLSRHTAKTVLTAISVAVGVALYIFIDAMLLGADIDSQRNIINYETGSAKIYSRDYYEKKDELPMYDSFTGYQPILEKLDENGFNAAPRSVFAGTLISKSKEIPFLFIGIDPDRERRVFKYDKFIEKGNFVRKGHFEILIGSKGAYNLKVTVGDSLRLFTIIDKKDETGKIRHISQVMDLKIAGIINSPNPKTNGNIGYLPLDILQGEMGLLLQGSITEICIRKKNASLTELPGKGESPNVIKNILNGALSSNLVLVGWEEDVKDYLLVSKTKSSSSKILTFLLFIIAYIGIANTILMSVMERTREIGMLRALGMTDFSVLKIFIYEAGLIGLIGAVSGMIIGVLLNLYMVNIGIDFTKMLESYGTNYGYRVMGVFKSAWNFNVIFLSGIIATIIAGFTAIFPTRRALKMLISDALRFD